MKSHHTGDDRGHGQSNDDMVITTGQNWPGLLLFMIGNVRHRHRLHRCLVLRMCYIKYVVYVYFRPICTYGRMQVYLLT